MERRTFLAQSVAAGMAATALAASERQDRRMPQHQFKLAYAPHFGMFRNLAGEDPLAQLRYAAEVGFTAWEDNGMKGRPPEQQDAIAREMERLGMQMGVFVAHGNFGATDFAAPTDEQREQVLADMRAAVELAKRVNAKWCTVVPGAYANNLEWDYQTANVIELLKRCAEICEPSGLVMVLEPLNWWANHPGLFLHKIPQAYLICEAVDSPSCKILFDIYHQQVTEGNLIANMERAWSQIGYFQIGDNPGRKEPGTGEINYRNVFRHLHGKGWTGPMGMEHGISKPGAEGEQQLIQAYVDADAF